MRGDANRQVTMLTAITPDDKVPKDPPPPELKPIVDRALQKLSPTFNAMYAKVGRPSIPPEHLLKGCLLIALPIFRSERQFCERLEYDLLFKWFLDLNIEDPAFDASTFSKNKERLLEHDVARRFFVAVREEARRRQLLSAEHFTGEGTLLGAWAWRNETHVSTTDAEVRLARKGGGKEARLCDAGHVLTENLTGLVVEVAVTEATGTAEGEAGLEMLGRQRRWRRRTVGADKGEDTKGFVAGCRARGGRPQGGDNTK